MAGVRWGGGGGGAPGEKPLRPLKGGGDSDPNKKHGERVRAVRRVEEGGAVGRRRAKGIEVSEGAPLLSLKGEGDKHAKHKHGKWVSSQEDILGSRKTPGDVSALRPWTRLHKAGAPRPWVTLAQDTRPYLPELLSPPRSPPAADTLWPAACPARKPTPKRG